MKFVLALGFALMAGGAQAGMFVCSFTSECYEAEACQGSAFSMDVDLPDEESGPAAFLLDTGVANGGAKQMRGTVFVGGEDSEAVYLLGVDGGGKAKFAVHYADPLIMVTYHGTCMRPE